MLSKIRPCLSGVPLDSHGFDYIMLLIRCIEFHDHFWPNVAAHREPDLSAIRWSRWFGGGFEFNSSSRILIKVSSSSMEDKVPALP